MSAQSQVFAEKWPIVGLGEIAEILGGKPAPQDPKAFAATGIPFVRMKDLGRYHLTSNLQEVDGFIDVEYAQKNNLSPIKAGAILMPRSGSVALNHRAILGRDAIIVSHICAIQAKPDIVLNEYLYRFLCTQRLDNITKKTTGLDAINFSDLRKLKIPLPPLSMQRRIAAILDKADAIRHKREQALSLADDFLRSVFTEMFGRPGQPNPSLPTDELGRSCDLFAGNSLPGGTTFNGQEHGLLLLKVGDMNLPGNEDVVQVAREWIDEGRVSGPAIRAPKDAIVFPKRGGAIATNKKRVLGRDCILDPNLMAVAPKTGSPISFQFLRVWFDLLDLSTLSNGSTVPQLNKGDLKPLELPIPRPNDLIAFDRIFGSVTRVRQRLADDLGMSESLFAALSQRAFSGDL